MRFSSAVMAVMLAGSAMAANPSAKEVLRSLDITLQRIISLNLTVDVFSPTNPGNLQNAFEIQTKVNLIQTTLNYITKIAKRTKGVYSDDDSVSVAVAVANLEDPITQTLNNVVANRKYFTSSVPGGGDLSATVLYDLKLLQSLVGVVGAAVVPHISETYRPNGVPLILEVQALFNSSIKAFAKCGRVCLPVITLQPGDGSIPGQGHYGYGYGY